MPLSEGKASYRRVGMGVGGDPALLASPPLPHTLTTAAAEPLGSQAQALHAWGTRPRPRGCPPPLRPLRQHTGAAAVCPSRGLWLLLGAGWSKPDTQLGKAKAGRQKDREDRQQQGGGEQSRHGPESQGRGGPGKSPGLSLPPSLPPGRPLPTFLPLLAPPVPAGATEQSRAQAGVGWEAGWGSSPSSSPLPRALASGGRGQMAGLNRPPCPALPCPRRQPWLVDPPRAQGEAASRACLAGPASLSQNSRKPGLRGGGRRRGWRGREAGGKVGQAEPPPHGHRARARQAKTTGEGKGREGKEGV